MSSCCLTIADLMADALAGVTGAIGVTAIYYSAVLTGYDTAETERDPSESTPVSVVGIFTNQTQTAPDMVLTRTASFTFAHSASLGFTPSATDRLVIGAYSYRATAVEIEQIGDTPFSYTLALVSD